MPFSSYALGAVRAQVAKMLTETCRIEQEAQGRGLMGEPLHGNWEVVASAVSCRLIRSQTPNMTRTREVGAQEAIVERYRLIAPRGTAFTVDNRVVMSNGDVYQVVDVEDKLSDAAFSGCVVVRQR